MTGRSGLERLLVLACIAAGFVHILIFIGVASARMTYPFSIDGMEGGMLVETHRAIAGLPLYAKPSIEFASFMYTPVFYYASAVFAHVVGNGFTCMRLVSFLSILGSLALIFEWVRWRTGLLVPAILAAACFAACYMPCGYYFDPGRVDPLALFWILGALFLVTRATGTPAFVVGGLLAAAACQTKQSELPIVAAAGLIAVIRGWRFGAVFGISAGIALGASFWWLNSQSDGWYAFYTLDLPLHQVPIKASWLAFWMTDIFDKLPIPALFAIAALATRMQRKDWRQTSIEFIAFAGLVGCSWLGRIHAGGWVNVLLPAYAAFSVALGCGYARLRDETPAWSTSLGGVLLAGLCLIQFVLMYGDPSREIPSAEDRARGEAFVRFVAAQPGDVWIPDHGYLAEMAGKKPFVHRFAVQDLLRSPSTQVRDPFAKEIEDALDSKRFGALIMDNPIIKGTGQYSVLAAPKYHLAGAVPFEGDAFHTVVGWPMRPEFVFRP